MSTTTKTTTATTTTTMQLKSPPPSYDPKEIAEKHRFQKCHPKLWAIHGQYYDLSSFVDRHPGGEEMILLGRGRDCTELFESVHTLSRKSIHQILAKYRVDTPPEGPPPPEEIFTWKTDGFYAVLSDRVKKMFADRSLEDNGVEEYASSIYKANSGWWVKVGVMLCLWMTCVSYAWTHGSVLVALLGGFLMNMLGFCVMHDGSHYGISAKPWVNRSLHILWNSWNLWSHWIWLRHHVYGHHSYTGVFRRDPDLVNASIFIRKTVELKHKPRFETQRYHGWILLLTLPNQHVGQVILYLRSWMVRNIFGVPFGKDRIPAIDFIAAFSLYILSILFHFVLPFYLLPSAWTAYWVIVAYWTAQGIGYCINIIPNHDTLHTHNHVVYNDDKRDWGEQQVLGSGNHSTDGGLWSNTVATLWGGMNYQIEHHLFPSVSHVHFPAIAKIVQQTCKEFDIPYVTHSWFHAFVSFGQLLSLLGRKPIDQDPSSKAKNE